MANYPYEKTNPIVLQVIDDVTSIDSALFLKYANAIIRIENELGIKPSGTYSDVRSRLDAMELGDDGYTGGSPHSTTIATHFRHNWLNPVIPTPTGNETLPTVIGQIMVNPPYEAGYSDGYGINYFINRLYVDQGITQLTLELWEITNAPYLVSTANFAPGAHNHIAVVALPFGLSFNRTYELRCYQAGAGDNVNSIMWNSRFLFVPTKIADTTQSNLSYISKDFDFNDGYEILIGMIPAQSMVQSVALTISTVFDGYGEAISVGDVGDHERLMATTSNIPSVTDTYLTNPNYLCAGDTSFSIYMAGTSTTGAGTAIIYYH